jgi:hypothetical protein
MCGTLSGSMSARLLEAFPGDEDGLCRSDVVPPALDSILEC